MPTRLYHHWNACVSMIILIIVTAVLEETGKLILFTNNKLQETNVKIKYGPVLKVFSCFSTHLLFSILLCDWVK